jgi:hypothetical protein
VKNKRELILNKSGGKCWYCGCNLNGTRWQADHFYPVIRVGGEMLYPELDTFDNLVPSCAPCNNFKSSSNIEGMRFRVNEQFENTLKNSVGLRQLDRMGLIWFINDEPVKFWFEHQGLSVKPEYDICGISQEARNVVWMVDNGEPDYFHQWFGDIMVTLRGMGSYWLVIAITQDWDSSDRTELPNGRLVKAQAAEWALRLAHSSKAGTL